MNLTQEQKEIVDKIQSLNSHLVINAYAGTGKTTTLKAIAETYPNYRFLYLAYNTSVKEEAQNKFPSNVKVLTTHGLAYRWYIQTFGKAPNVTGSLRPYDISVTYNLPYNLAFVVSKIMHEFCNSDDKDISDTSSRVCSIYKDIVRTRADFIIASETASDLWQKMVARELPVTHDFYLKLASLDSDIGDHLSSYDFILVDEAQDTNPVVYEILLKSGKPLIAVGDTNQKIYGFRNAMDIMQDLKANHNADTLYLTNSFRFPQEIADLAFDILMQKPGFAEMNWPKIKGLGPKDDSKTKAIITRTNAGIIDKIIVYHKYNDTNFYTYRTPSEIFSIPMAIAHKFRGIQPPFKIPDPIQRFIYSFSSMGELAEYANDAMDLEVKRSIDIVDSKCHILKDLYNFHKKANRKKQGTCILTAHTSKGLEFGEVEIYGDWDISAFLGRKSKSIEAIIEEHNLLYVAATRAIHTLKENGIIKDLLKLDDKVSISKKPLSVDELF